MPTHLHTRTRVPTWAIVAICAIGGLFLFLATKAHAADKGGPNVFADVPAPARSPSWTGFYIGVLGGYDRHDTELAGGIASFSARDFSYGGNIGADYQFKHTRIVVGINLDYMATNANSTVSSFNGTASLTGRLGFLPSDYMLLYVLGGYSKADLANSLSKPLNLDQGLTVGVGAEAYLFKNVSAKVEYRWTDEGSKATCGSPFCSVDQTGQSVRAGLNWRF